LGLSGTSAAHRQGFRDLMSRVCLGEVGAVLGLEVSRLARSNADLARLAEMARLTGTLLIDSDGVYDLSDFNDWLGLGLSAPARPASLTSPNVPARLTQPALAPGYLRRLHARFLVGPVSIGGQPHRQEVHAGPGVAVA